MKRILVVLTLAAGMLVMGVTDVSASNYCSLDPTVNVGTPIKYSLDVHLSLLGLSAHVYASGTKKTTTFGGVLGL
jgi:hypothetical protein